MESLPNRVRFAPELQGCVVCQRGIGRQLRGNEIRIDWRSGGVGAARHHGIQTGPHAQQASIGDISPQKAVGGARAPAGGLGPSGFELGPGEHRSPVEELT